MAAELSVAAGVGGAISKAWSRQQLRDCVVYVQVKATTRITEEKRKKKSDNR